MLLMEVIFIFANRFKIVGDHTPTHLKKGLTLEVFWKVFPVGIIPTHRRIQKIASALAIKYEPLKRINPPQGKKGSDFIPPGVIPQGSQCISCKPVLLQILKHFFHDFASVGVDVLHTLGLHINLHVLRNGWVFVHLWPCRECVVVRIAGADEVREIRLHGG